jgi:UDP-N-acetylmuramoyl-L-alanyl-D-glutamate--2,6-diaminopimelate ligase
MLEGCGARAIRFGLDAIDADVNARAVELGLARTRFTLQLGRRDAAVDTRLVGRHNIQNILAAAAAAEALGISPSAIQRGIAALTAVRGRLQRVESSVPFSVFVDYAHTPDALRNVLGLLREVSRGQIICVFGCGGDRDRTKRPLMARAAAELADVAVVTSDNPRSEDPDAILDEVMTGFAAGDECRVIREADRRMAIGEALSLARPGDVVLIAGKGHEDYQIIGTQRRWFDDVMVARDALAAVKEVA